MARKRKRDLKGTICLRRPIDGDIDSDVQIQQKNYEDKKILARQGQGANCMNVAA